MRMCSVAKAITFGVGVVGLGLLPTQGGLQDLRALIAPRPAAAAGIRQHLLASPFGTIHAALFSFPQPAGADMPRPIEFHLASLNLGDGDITGSIGMQALMDMRDHTRVFPEVNRAQKGDRLVPDVKPEPALAPAPAATPKPQQGAERAPSDGEATYALASVSLTDVAPDVDERGRDEPATAAANGAAAKTVAATKVAVAVDAAPESRPLPI